MLDRTYAGSLDPDLDPDHSRGLYEVPGDRISLVADRFTVRQLQAMAGETEIVSLDLASLVSVGAKVLG